MRLQVILAQKTHRHREQNRTKAHTQTGTSTRTQPPQIQNGKEKTQREAHTKKKRQMTPETETGGHVKQDMPQTATQTHNRNQGFRYISQFTALSACVCLFESF